jgi:hypothetical protein
MAPVIVLVGATLVLRGLGALGVDAFGTWVFQPARARVACSFEAGA